MMIYLTLQVVTLICRDITNENIRSGIFVESFISKNFFHSFEGELIDVIFSDYFNALSHCIYYCSYAIFSSETFDCKFSFLLTLSLFERHSSSLG